MSRAGQVRTMAAGDRCAISTQTSSTGKDRTMTGIVVGYDGSECGAAALRWAMGEAIARDTAVRVVAVLEPRMVGSLGSTMLASTTVWQRPPDADIAEAAQQAEEAVGKISADFAAPPQVDVSVVLGHAGERLVHAAADADQLVVGSHGRSAVECMLLGSVSTFAVHHAHCPVTVVRSAGGDGD